MDTTRGDIEQAGTLSITFYPSSHTPQSFQKDAGLRVSAGEDPPLAFLRAVAREQSQTCAELLYSSVPTNAKESRDFIPQRNGFVYTVIEAYNRHRALIIRPDDVWLAILTQFCFFVNGNAEALRSTFVAHEGKKELVIIAGGNRYTMDPANMANQMTVLMQDNIVDEVLREWIMPNFTTTTALDRATSAIVMMGTMKEYFSYTFHLMCGIPKVTLEGEKKDWEEILCRLERLKKYGVQAIAWYHLLRPIISRFVGAYDNPSAAANLEFWNKVAHFSGGGSGPRWLSGWITAFCVFDERGRWQGNTFKESADREDGKDPLSLSASQFASVYLLPMNQTKSGQLNLDGFPYFKIDSNDVPCGYTQVDVKLDDNGETFGTIFIAGSIGSQISSTAKTEAFPEGTRDTVRPIPGWWYFIKGKGPKESVPMCEMSTSESTPEHKSSNTSVASSSHGDTVETKSSFSFYYDIIAGVKSRFDALRRMY